MNRELEKIIAYLSSRGPGLKLQAIAMPVYIRDGLEISAPQVHGQLNQPDAVDASRAPNLTFDQILTKARMNTPGIYCKSQLQNGTH